MVKNGDSLNVNGGPRKGWLNLNKRSFALIMATAVLVLCFLSPFASAVTISYTTDSGGESVSINENYDVDDSATGNTLGVAQTVSATGDAELHIEGEEGGNMAAHVAMVESGKLNSKQK